MSIADMTSVSDIVTRLDAAKPARFSYTQAAFDGNDIEGVDTFNPANAQNIPNDTKTDYDSIVLDRGARTQAASIPRMAWNHFIGRFSYNIAKLTEQTKLFVDAEIIAAAHNAFEYDASQKYRQGDTCYIIRTVNTVSVIEFWTRISAAPLVITGVSPIAGGQTDWQMSQANAGLLDGKKPDTASTANTVAMRDANGRAQFAKAAAQKDALTWEAFPVGAMMMFDANHAAGGSGGASGAWVDDSTMPGWFAMVAANSIWGCQDMSGRFVMGKVVAGAGATGGTNSYQISAAHLPVHTHTIDHDHGNASTSDQSVYHSHTDAGHNHSLPMGNSPASGGNVMMTPSYSGNTVGTAPGYASLGTETANHIHTLDLPNFTGNSGNGGFANNAVDNRPAYYDVIYIRKCK